LSSALQEELITSPLVIARPDADCHLLLPAYRLRLAAEFSVVQGGLFLPCKKHNTLFENIRA
jgi:hypothetical protein